MSAALRVLLVDHQDSFAWNLAHALGAVTGELPEVVDHRALDPERIAAEPPGLLVLGAGPGHPEQPRDAGRSLELLRALPADVPTFGVCFGLQLVVTAFGGKVVPALAPVHGKSVAVVHAESGGKDGAAASGLFAGLPSPVSMMRYHSFVAQREGWPRELRVVGESPLGEVMALVHVRRPIWAVQFHPESIGSPLGARLIENVVALARRRADVEHAEPTT